MSADVGGWRHDGGIEAWPSTTFKAADGWEHNCVFDIETTLASSLDGTVPDVTWVTGGDERSLPRHAVLVRPALVDRDF